MADWISCTACRPCSRVDCICFEATATSYAAPEFPEYDRPGRAAAVNPEDDEDFLRKVRERAEDQRRRYRESQRDEDPDATA